MARRTSLLALSFVLLLTCGQSVILPGITTVMAESHETGSKAAGPPLATKGPVILDNDRQLVPAALKDQRANFVLTVEDRTTSGKSVDYLAIMEIRDSKGVTIFLKWKPEHIEAGSAQNTTFTWIPVLSGSYEVRTSVIRSFEVPEILSGASTSPVKVVVSMDDLQMLIKETRPPPTVGENLDTGGGSGNQDETPIGVAHKKVDYTVLVYMVASNLESSGYYATEDLKEMMAIGSSPKVNVIVQTGGGSENSTIDDYRFIDFTKVQRHLILKDEARLIRDEGERNMGDYQTLTSFLGWGVSTYPADRYVAILWNDGAGLRGFGFDPKNDDFLTPGEIGDAFAKVDTDFEVIGFDACLMASIEIASRINEHGNYMVASEELEPGWGWDYSAIVSSLVENPEQDGLSLGRTIADSYFAHVKAKADEHSDFNLERGATLSVIDLSKIKEIVSFVNNLSGYFNKYVTDLDETYSLTKSIKGTERYGEGGSESSGHLDIYNFVDELQRSFPEFAGMPDTLKSLVQDAVVYKVNGEAKPNSHGISIYMQIDEYEPNAPYLRYAIGEWVSVLENNRARLGEDIHPPDVDLLMKTDATNTITGKISSDDLDVVSLYITQKSDDDESKTRVVSAEHLKPSNFLDSADGTVRFVWNEEIISLCNHPGNEKEDCRTTIIYFEENGVTDFAYVPARIESAGGYNGTLIFIYEVIENAKGEGQFFFLGGWPGIDEEGNAIRELIPLTEGDKIYTYMFEIDYDDLNYFKELENNPITVKEEFGPAYHSYSGTYELFVNACDFSGNCMSSQDFSFTVQ